MEIYVNGGLKRVLAVFAICQVITTRFFIPVYFCITGFALQLRSDMKSLINGLVAMSHGWKNITWVQLTCDFMAHLSLEPRLVVIRTGDRVISGTGRGTHINGLNNTFHHSAHSLVTDTTEEIDRSGYFRQRFT